MIISKELNTAIEAAKMAGIFLKTHFNDVKKVDEASQNDIKLELDKLSQALITRHILSNFPDHAILGEESKEGNPDSNHEWIVDPIDGTVNYYYGIPAFCVSIALRIDGRIQLGVIYDPMMDECWHTEGTGPSYLNDRIIHCSDRTKMAEAIVFVGHGKTDGSKEKGIERFAKIAHQVRKIRINGSAALAMAYIAAARFDSYVESTISIWDIAAGIILVENAGGIAQYEPRPEDPETGSIIAWNGKIPILESL